MTSTSSAQAAYVPWFSRRSGLALAGVLAMFVSITVARFSLGDDGSPGVTVLYVVPVSLAALAWGRLGGLISSGLALVLIALWVLVADVDLTVLGWSARVVPILLVGLLLGDASDRLRRAEQAHVEQAERELLHRQAVEINDSLLQGMAAAKWALEAERHDVALECLNDAIASGQKLVAGLIRDSSMGPLDGLAGPSPH
jgi:glucose-6-phosphate-specific signal transduction histidine kinase